MTDIDYQVLFDEMDRRTPSAEVTFDIVRHNDDIKKLIWTTEFGQTPIPLAGFDYRYWVYYQAPSGEMVKTGPFLNEIVVPKVGDQVIILRPSGQLQFPVCVGKIQSQDHWD